jgi:hypothetical protein
MMGPVVVFLVFLVLVLVCSLLCLCWLFFSFPVFASLLVWN